MACLDIPIPECVRELLLEPPVCFPKLEDAQILDSIRRFGNELGRTHHEIEKACCLASGFSDIIIILERPRPSSTHEYRAPFDEFVRECRTLATVDELIRFASKGARSIHTVTVINAFFFTPDKNDDTANADRCHHLVEVILKTKRPRVVLCCWRGLRGNDFVSRFRSHGVGTWPVRDKESIEGSSAILIRSFHPSTVVNYRKLSPYSRMLLIYHFVLAFGELSRPQQYPQWLYDLCNESSRLVPPYSRDVLKLTGEFREENHDTTRSTDVEIIEFKILKLLQRMTTEIPKDGHAKTRSSSNHFQPRTQKDEIIDLLARLRSSKYSRGAIDITDLCLTLNYYTSEHGSHFTETGILVHLHEVGSQQRRLWPGPTPDRSLTTTVPKFDDDDDDDLGQGSKS